MLCVCVCVCVQIDIMKLEMMRLPTTRLMLENSCFLMQEASTTAWPLICDPTSRVLDWLTGLYQSRELVVVKYHVSCLSWSLLWSLWSVA